jgi:aerobic-type carbon monoxide dehydrogenase small subunit (CoxS/CutS family)
MPRVTSLEVNGKSRTVDADGQRPLLSVLRDDLDITGPKYGCGEGQCGACTVLIDGLPTRSCITKTESAVGKKIITIEGLAEGERLHPVQQAFLDEEALQCAYCTSGMILSAVALLKKKPDPTHDDVIEGMERNICRCGTYGRIVAAVLRAAKAMKEAQ